MLIWVFIYDRQYTPFLFTILVSGLLLRLIWQSDMEWKDDEQWMYAKAQEMVETKKFPAAGMQSGGGIVNPGMSVAVFTIIASVTRDPLLMDRVIQVINVVAILCFLIFTVYKVEEKEKEVWLWGIALASVSPLAVLFSRKIWAQDLLPIFSFLVILSNTYRKKPFGAFLWGLVGAISGQIHMSGFFLAAGLVVFTLLHDYYNKIKFYWKYWIAGSLIGSISIIPWINFMMHHPQFTRQSFWHIFQFNFYLYWFLDSHGLNIMYSMRKEFWHFIKEPIICGFPTCLIALAHLFLVYAGIISLTQIREYAKKGLDFIRKKTAAKKIFAGISTTRFYLFSVLLGLGIFMSLSGITIHPHYLICAFPFSYIFLAKILQQRKRLLKGIILAQLFITITFLIYVHTHNGVKQGDYGITYHEQLKQKNKK